jgi:hypothetical protein
MKKVGWVIAMALPLLGAPAMANEKGEQKDCKPVKMSEVPGVVQDTLLEQSQGGKVEELCKKGDKGTELYQAEIVKGGKGTEIVVNPAGTVVKRGKAHDESKEPEHKGGEGY